MTRTARVCWPAEAAWHWRALAVGVGWVLLAVGAELLVVALAGGAGVVGYLAAVDALRCGATPTDSTAQTNSGTPTNLRAPTNLKAQLAAAAPPVFAALSAGVVLAVLASSALAAWSVLGAAVLVGLLWLRPAPRAQFAVPATQRWLVAVAAGTAVAALAQASVAATVVLLAGLLLHATGIAAFRPADVAKEVAAEAVAAAGSGAVAYVACATALPPFTPDVLIGVTLLAFLGPPIGRLLAPSGHTTLARELSPALLVAPGWLLLIGT